VGLPRDFPYLLRAGFLGVWSIGDHLRSLRSDIPRQVHQGRV